MIESRGEEAIPESEVVSTAAPRRPLTLRPTSRGKIVGHNSQFAQILTVIDRVAKSNCTVLITGESGTGKEMVVAALHDASPRGHGPLIAVNCGAIPEALIESELFGHAKGSFTGAHVARQGRVAAAEAGTLFLDEIGEIPLGVQVKLLRLLQQREYSPVGETKTHRANVRIVAATNRNLEDEVAAGRFREDLYYRLNVIHVQLPPLRDRVDDVEPLAQHFFKHYAACAGRDDLIGLAPEALTALKAYNWPGNVRALENVIEHAVLLAPGPCIGVDDLPARVRGGTPASLTTPELPGDGIDLRSAVEAYESNLIRQALERTGWNKNQAARLLGINRTTLVEMIKRKRLRIAS